jgi:hypothetical protein
MSTRSQLSAERSSASGKFDEITRSNDSRRVQRTCITREEPCRRSATTPAAGQAKLLPSDGLDSQVHLTLTVVLASQAPAVRHALRRGMLDTFHYTGP